MSGLTAGNSFSAPQWARDESHLFMAAADNRRNVIVDLTDESAPTRYFYDLCKLPPSIGERRAATG